MTPAEIIQIVIGSLSLLATIAVSLLIYWMQRKHEKEQEALEERRIRDRQELEEQRIREQREREEKERAEKLAEEADHFLMDNADEKDYLPWCVIAANQHRLKKHARRIYSNFCRCSRDLQEEILRKAGFTITPIDKTDWVDKCFNQLRADIQKYSLAADGNDYLYDGAKYFHRGFEYYREIKYPFDDSYKYPPLWKDWGNGLFREKSITASSYIEQYFDYKLGLIPEEKLAIKEPMPPINYIWDSNHLGSVPNEEVVCYWVMLYVENILVNIYNRFRREEDNFIYDNMTDAEVEIYEDKYYSALLWLYGTYQSCGTTSSKLDHEQ